MKRPVKATCLRPGCAPTLHQSQADRTIWTADWLFVSFLCELICNPPPPWLLLAVQFNIISAAHNSSYGAADIFCQASEQGAHQNLKICVSSCNSDLLIQMRLPRNIENNNCIFNTRTGII